MPVPAVVTTVAKVGKAAQAYRNRGGRLWLVIVLVLLAASLPAFGCSALILIAASAWNRSQSSSDAAGAMSSRGKSVR